MKEVVVFICLDGCSPEYLHRGKVKNFERMSREGFYTEGDSIVPTVTNVNNVSLITGEYPDKHGITSNCYYDKTANSEVYMESPNFITAETIFEKAARRGLKTALLTAKEKMLTLLNKGVHTAFSAEKPPKWIANEVGFPPNIYSVEVNVWLLKALKFVLSKAKPDLVYVSTTDYVMHKYKPNEKEAKIHIEAVDEQIGEIINEFDGLSLCITADHGMSDKKIAVDLEGVLKEAGVTSKVISTVKDRYVFHHMNLSGSAYVYLEDVADLDKAYEKLIETEGVEEILTKYEASVKYHLPRERIGDLFLNGKEEYVFGHSDDGNTVRDVDIRSHGSLYEQAVPLLIYGIELARTKILKNKDLTSIVLDHLLKY